ncbi:hypothetical protein N7455_002649 [Penicillium solitum]|uniref:uncharacterized protein n=1 Tax=Penicillium solitum TaxID=60172 RepID=UPI0032C3F95D|nr:hypothetical protein N7455_002649 [Penicillium solitum]
MKLRQPITKAWHPPLSCDLEYFRYETYIHLDGSPANPEPPNLRDLSRAPSLEVFFFFFHPSLRTLSSDYKPSSFFLPSCSTHLPAMNHYRKFLFINVYHLSFTIPIHVF